MWLGSTYLTVKSQSLISNYLSAGWFFQWPRKMNCAKSVLESNCTCLIDTAVRVLMAYKCRRLRYQGCLSRIIFLGGLLRFFVLRLLLPKGFLVLAYPVSCAQKSLDPLGDTPIYNNFGHSISCSDKTCSFVSWRWPVVNWRDGHGFLKGFFKPGFLCWRPHGMRSCTSIYKMIWIVSSAVVLFI